MQFDPAGALASILSTVAPESGVAISMQNDPSAAGFDRILQQLNLIFDEHATGELPLDTREWDQWVNRLASVGGETADDFLKNLEALQSHLESLLREPDASGGAGGKGGIVSSGDDPLPFGQSKFARIDNEEHLAQTLSDALGLAPPGSQAKALLLGEKQDRAEKDALPPDTDGPSAEDLPGFAGVPLPIEATDQGNPRSQGQSSADPPPRLSPTPPSASGDGFGSAVSESGESKAEMTSLQHQEPQGGSESGFSHLMEGETPESIAGRDHLSLNDQAGSSRPGKAPSTAPLNLGQPLDHPEWGEALGERLLWMHGKSIQAAEIRINPQHLGPVEVRVEVHDEQTSIQFTSHHAAVREALEVALPRLREMFGSQQLQLAQVEVTGHSLPDQGNPQNGHEPAAPRDNEYGVDEGRGEAPGEEVGEQRLPVRGNRLLNLYA